MSLLDPPPARPRLPSVGESFRLLGDALSHRTALAKCELEEASQHAARSAILGALAVFLALFTGFAFTLLIAAIVWDSPHRAWWMAGLFMLYLGGAGGAAWALRRRLVEWRPLEETRLQVAEDQRQLGDLLRSSLP